MIVIESIEGQLIKTIKNPSSSFIGLHKVFGFISEASADKRLAVRKKRGFEFDHNQWLCRAHIKQDAKEIQFSNLEDCRVRKDHGKQWVLSTTRGEFVIREYSEVKTIDSLVTCEEKTRWPSTIIEGVLFFICLMIPFFYFLTMPKKDISPEKAQQLKPLSVKIVKQHQAVNVKRSHSTSKMRALTKVEKAKRAVQRNLGFLGLVGQKNLTKAVGGVPQKLKKVTAGAGMGGNAGSGGEVLTGLGKGLKKTSVGNTGLKGLGGVGTKGSGGGAGGQGHTVLASGEGVGISGIAMANNEIILDGGLSRYAINATIAKYLGQVRRCYEQELNKRSALEGLVTVSFQINRLGKLNYARVKDSSLKNKKVESCITKKMMSWKFPQPKGGVSVTINYPFMLRPVGT